ncbi:hypothetical protein SAMN05518854_11556 [Variovorax sp. YR266]|nr:hypothetical protein SAMN05518854_11556 [Variovorax sp. YR266]
MKSFAGNYPLREQQQVFTASTAAVSATNLASIRRSWRVQRRNPATHAPIMEGIR